MVWKVNPTEKINAGSERFQIKTTPEQMNLSEGREPEGPRTG